MISQHIAVLCCRFTTLRNSLLPELLSDPAMNPGTEQCTNLFHVYHCLQHIALCIRALFHRGLQPTINRRAKGKLPRPFHDVFFHQQAPLPC